MFLWTIKWVIISVVLILLIHNIYNFLKESLTIPKTRDLVSKIDSRYEDLNQNLNNKKQSETNDVTDTENMETELKQFLNDIDKESNVDGSVTEIDTLINLNKPD